MTIPTEDRAILRELGRRKAEIGQLPAQKEKFELWRRLNRLEPVRPLVWMNELPWHELRAADRFLEPICTDPYLRQVENSLRMELYQWEHFACDMIVEPVLYCGIVGGPASSYGDYGIKEQLHQETGGQDVGYIPVIHTEADADQIRTPEVWYDRDATEKNCQILGEIFDGILPVQKRGIVQQWHSPWDQMISTSTNTQKEFMIKNILHEMPMERLRSSGHGMASTLRIFREWQNI